MELSNAAKAALLAVIGVSVSVSVGFTDLGLQTALYDTVPPDDVGAAAGLFQTSRYLGTILSASLLGLLFGNQIDTANLHRLAWCLAAVSALVVVLHLPLPGQRPAGSWT